jgi:hypothetical protein
MPLQIGRYVIVAEAAREYFPLVTKLEFVTNPSIPKLSFIRGTCVPKGNFGTRSKEKPPSTKSRFNSARQEFMDDPLPWS